MSKPAQRDSPARRVVCVGAGFAGLALAKSLGNREGIKVTLIDRRNFHLFQPLLYQVAMAGLSPAEIAVPIRSILSSFTNIEVLLGNVTGFDLRKKLLMMDSTVLDYDYLVLACGAEHGYFGKDQWETHAPGLKTLEQATEIRRRVLLAFEMAEREKDPDIQKKHLTFVVIGGGPTGVELAGALGEISRHTLRKDFTRIAPEKTRIFLIETGDRVLSAFSEELSARAARDLEAIGVRVMTSTRVTDVGADGVWVGEKLIRSSTVLWAAGVQPSNLNPLLNADLDKSGRVIVEKDLSLKAFPAVFILGDQARTEDSFGKPLPGLAPVAMQEGSWTAKNIMKDMKGKPRLPFTYVEKGQMATIGRKRAVVEYGKLKISGFFAWLLWLFVHIYYLIGFENKLLVFTQWAWAYFTYDRGARLIMSNEWRSMKPTG